MLIINIYFFILFFLLVFFMFGQDREHLTVSKEYLAIALALDALVWASAA
jgi:hypothetical protein